MSRDPYFGRYPLDTRIVMADGVVVNVEAEIESPRDGADCDGDCRSCKPEIRAEICGEPEAPQ